MLKYAIEVETVGDETFSFTPGVVRLRGWIETINDTRKAPPLSNVPAGEFALFPWHREPAYRAFGLVMIALCTAMVLAIRML